MRPGLDPSSVTPGTLGFLATLFVVVLVILLIRDMVRRIRRVRYSAEVQQARAQRNAAASGGDGASAPGDGAAEGRGDVGRPLPDGRDGPDNR